MLKKIIKGFSNSIHVLVCCLFFQSLEAQTLEHLPLVNSFSFQPLFYNPAAGTDAPFELNANFHSYTGDYSDVNATYISALYNFNSSQEKSKRAIGTLFLHEATGDFFKRTRGYILYQEQANISQNFWVRAGAQVGLVNFNLVSIGFGPGGSAWNVDAAVALNVGGDKWSAGFVLQQFPNSTLKPIVFTFELQPYQEWFINYKVDLSTLVSYQPSLRVQKLANENVFLISNTIEIDEQYGVNGTWNWDKGVAVLGFYKVRNYKFFASYFTPLSQNLKHVDTMQFELGATFFTQTEQFLKHQKLSGDFFSIVFRFLR